MENTPHQERAAHQTTKDILNSTTEHNSRPIDRSFNNKSISQNTENSDRSNKETKSVEQEQLPELEPPNIDIDRDSSRNTSFKQWLGAKKELLQQKKEALQQRYPKTTQTARLVGRYLHEERTEIAAKTVKRQAAGTVLPGWGNVAMGGYSAWDTYKDLRAFIDHAKKHPDLNPSKLKKETRPFHEIAKEQREKMATKLEKNLWAKEGKPQYNSWADQMEHPQGKNLNRVRDEIRSQSDKIRHAPKSFEEKLSEEASKYPQQLSDFRRHSQERAAVYERAGLKGEATDKYHWLLNQAEKDLGKGYFNPETNPKGVLAYERFAKEHLQVSGYSKPQIDKACRQGVACEVLSLKNQETLQRLQQKDPDFKINNQNLENGKYLVTRQLALEDLNKQFPQKVSKDLETVHSRTKAFQHDNPVAKELKLTPEEYTFQKELPQTIAPNNPAPKRVTEPARSHKENAAARQQAPKANPTQHHEIDEIER